MLAATLLHMLGRLTQELGNEVGTATARSQVAVSGFRQREHADVISSPLVT
jgi:hypothetical protein